MQQPFVIKERLRALIGEGRVRAALFYTFNFDPRFFENYVMPLLVPGETFFNNAIANTLLWRRLYRKGDVPPVTVYFDAYAKDQTAGPMLPYHSVQVSLPPVGRNRGNFHPKQSFVLVTQPDGEEQLIVLTGSNNITQSGWCDNLECVGELVLVNGKMFPPRLKDALRSLVGGVLEAFGRDLTLAEELVLRFLNGRGTTRERDVVFYHSLQTPFAVFVEEEILSDDSVREVEILSPFLSPDTQLVHWLLERGLNVRLVAPFRGDYCTLTAKQLRSYESAGARWYLPRRAKVSSEADERTVHSKLYRFYGADCTYTVAGSVNFTLPAWAGLGGPAVGNMESALLYRTADVRRFLYPYELDIDSACCLDALPADEENRFEQRFDVPDLEFTIHWDTRVLSWKGKARNPCFVAFTDGARFPLAGAREQSLAGLPNGDKIIGGLARSALIPVIEIVDGTERRHLFYPLQEGFGQKPLEFRFPSAEIISFWESLGDEEKAAEARERIFRKLEQATEEAEDESGRIKTRIAPADSLLNEMARHFHGLNRLEHFLFPADAQWTARRRAAHARELAYFLADDNYNTLASYREGLATRYRNGELLRGYYWLLLTILLQRFYRHPQLPRLLRDLFEGEERRQMRRSLERVAGELCAAQEALEQDMDIDKRKLTWAQEALTDYATLD